MFQECEQRSIRIGTAASPFLGFPCPEPGSRLRRSSPRSFNQGGRMSKFFNRMAGLLMIGTLAVAVPATAADDAASRYATKTPIKHVVIIFQENVSFDHYFGTYPNAKNPRGESRFIGRPNTPAVNGLNRGLLIANPNGAGAQPFRLDPSQNYTCDQTHNYTPEQQAFDAGLMDKFPQFTGKACSATTYPSLAQYGTSVVMGYYDGNTTTAL